MRKKLSKVLVTGGAGFIGSEFVRQEAGHGCSIVVVDSLTYAGDLARLEAVRGKYKFAKVDICNRLALESVFKKEKPDYVVHFAAESHVDRSIQDASPFIATNIGGTQVLLDLSRKYNIKKFVHISTDEVYGEIKKGRFSENSLIAPNSPYAASKAASDLLVKSYVRTYKFPAVIIRASNNYGPWQYPEKLLPVAILKVLNGQKVPVYAKGENIREWLYVSDCARAISLVLKKGRIGEVYNIGSSDELKNLVTVKKLLCYMGKDENSIQFVQDRPGHDFRYALNCSKIKKLGWKKRVAFDEGLKKTINWYMQNGNWLESKLEFLTKYWKKTYRV